MTQPSMCAHAEQNIMKCMSGGDHLGGTRRLHLAGASTRGVHLRPLGVRGGGAPPGAGGRLPKGPPAGRRGGLPRVARQLSVQQCHSRQDVFHHGPWLGHLIVAHLASQAGHRSLCPSVVRHPMMYGICLQSTHQTGKQMCQMCGREIHRVKDALGLAGPITTVFPL